ncbi:MAG TPA: hypothetical protein EYH32_00435 [Anaerolineae bacterium]|nr:hypothetical protein [Anaerolineae bacterium]
MDATLTWVMSILGVVAFFVVEGLKWYARLRGRPLSSTGKLWVVLGVSLALAVIGGLVTGELDLSVVVGGLASLPSDPMAAVAAVVELIGELLATVGAVLVVAQAIYAALKRRLQENGILSFSAKHRLLGLDDDLLME